MELQYLNDEFAVTGQLSVADVSKAADAGFTTIVCNRPDGEAPDQTPSADIQAECAGLGLKFVYIPMNGPVYSAEDVSTLRNAISDDAGGKVLGYCRTGNRSSILWNALQA